MRGRRRTLSAIVTCLGIIASTGAPALAQGWDPQAQSLRNQEIALTFHEGTTKTFQNAAGAHLLFPGPTSPIVVRVDGRDYVLAGRPRFEARPGESWVRFIHDLEGATATVEYALAGPSVRISVSLTNGRAQAVQAAVRVLLDTQVGPNDGSPFFVDGVGLLTSERAWDGAPFTEWFGYDRYPSPQITGVGRLETPPDRVVLAYWRALGREGLQRYEYVPAGRDFSHDSSLLAFYQLGTVAPGATSRRVSLAYGSRPPRAASPSEALVRAVRELAAAMRAKHAADLDTTALIDALALDAITDGRPAGARLDRFRWDSIEDIGRTLAEVAVTAPVDATGASLALALAPLSLGLDALLFAREETQTREYLVRHFSAYREVLAEAEGSMLEQLPKIRQVLARETGDELEAAIGPLEAFAARLEGGEVRLREDYPYDPILDVLDRARQGVLLSTRAETIVAAPDASGRRLELHLLGSLGPQRTRIEQAGEMERSAGLQRRVARWVSWGGASVGIGLKIVAALHSGGITALAEGLLGLGATGVSTGFKITGSATDLASDQLHVVLALQAATAWHYERHEGLRLARAVPDGVLRAVPEPQVDVGIEAFSVADGPPESDEPVALDGHLTLVNRASGPVPASVLIIVPGVTEGSPPLAVAAPPAESLNPGSTTLRFALVVPPPGQLGGGLRQLRARAFIGVGMAEMRLASCTFRVGGGRYLAARESRVVGRGALARGQEQEFGVEIPADAGPSVFTLDYEGSDFDLHVIDPEGRHVGPDYRSGRTEAAIPGGGYTSGVATEEIRLLTPRAGRYRVRVVCVTAHRNEDFEVSLDTGPRPAGPILTLRPQTVHFTPTDDPDLVAVEVVEVTGVHDAGALSVAGIASEAWRASGPLRAGGVVRLELRKPGQMFRQGVTALEISAGGVSTTLRLAPVPEEVTARANSLTESLAAARSQRHALLQAAGAVPDLWEATRFGEYADPEVARALERRGPDVALPESQAPTWGSRGVAASGESEPPAAVGGLFALVPGWLWLFFAAAAVFCAGSAAIAVARSRGRTPSPATAPAPARQVLRSIRIGRAPDNDVVLADASVSAHHAVLRHDGDRWLICDLGSENGVLLNGVKVREATVVASDSVILGSRTVLVSELTREKAD